MTDLIPLPAPLISWRRWIAALAIFDLFFVLSDNPEAIDLASFLHLPWELALVVLLPALIPHRLWRFVQPVLAVVLTLIVAVKLANLVTLEGFGRPFAPLADLQLIPTALGTLAKNSIALAVLAIAAALAVVALIGLAAAWALATTARALRLPGWLWAMTGLVGACLCLSFVSLGNGAYPLTDAGTSLFVRNQVQALIDDLRDTAQFRRDMTAPDPAPPTGSLSALRGTDVLLIFVESYGQSALTLEPYAGIVRPALTSAEKTLIKAGFHSRSAWLTSPTFGGESWLAHSTVLSGLWVTTQARYQALVHSSRSTLVRDFKQAGWRTTALMPEITDAWPDRRFFGFDSAYTAPELGYRGPPFGYMTMPDQYVLAAFNTHAFAGTDRPPLFAEIALVSSHIPWVPIPRFVPWNQVGDGTIFATARSSENGDDVWRDPHQIAVFYARSLEYVLQTVTSFITTYGRDNTLVILLGDHQPMSFISKDPSDHDVPVHIITRNPALLRALGDGWTKGMIPDAASPVMRMDKLRGLILNAFTP